MACVITLTGASGCGKSTIIQILEELGKQACYKNVFQPVMIPKYTTRILRAEEISRIQNNNAYDNDVRPVCPPYNTVTGIDGAPLSESMQSWYRIQAFNKLNCDLVYEQYGNRYGLYMSEIYDCLKRGKSPIIILNDVRTVEDIKTFLGEKCISLFIFRHTPSQELYEKQEQNRHTTPEEADNRFQKAQAIHRIYIENIHIFDKLILNVQNDPQKNSLRKLLNQLVEKICQEKACFAGNKST